MNFVQEQLKSQPEKNWKFVFCLLDKSPVPSLLWQPLGFKPTEWLKLKIKERTRKTTARSKKNRNTKKT